MSKPVLQEWVTFAQALDISRHAFQCDKPQDGLIDALRRGALKARAGRIQSEIGNDRPVGSGRNQIILKPDQWFRIEVTHPERGEAIERMNNGQDRFYDLRLHRDGLESLVGKQIAPEISGKPVGRRVNEANIEVCVRVALSWATRSKIKLASVTTKEISSSLVEEFTRQEIPLPSETTLASDAAAIKRALTHQE